MLFPQGTLKFDKKYLNEEFSDFVSIVKLFIKESNCAQTPKAACLACAGPILDNTVNFTNIATGWVIDGNELAADFGIRKVCLDLTLTVQRQLLQGMCLVLAISMSPAK